MPNWCFTDYVIEGSNEDLKCIDKAICDVLDGKFPKQEKSSQDWVGNVLHALRIPTERKDGQPLAYFRAFVCDKPTWINDNAIRFSTQEAWCRTMFAEALHIRFKDICVYWSLQEEFCQLMQTNDFDGKYFKDRFYVNICLDGEYYSDSFPCKEFAWTFVHEVAGCADEEEAELFNKAHENDDYYIYVFEYDVVDDGFDFDDDIELMEEPDRNLF